MQPVKGTWNESSTSAFSTLVAESPLYASLTKTCGLQHWIKLTTKEVDGMRVDVRI